MKYNVVRLDYGVRDYYGCYHQTHKLSAHRTLTAAIKSFLKYQKIFNCVDIVDDSGKKVNFIY